MKLLLFDEIKFIFSESSKQPIGAAFGLSFGTLDVFKLDQLVVKVIEFLFKEGVGCLRADFLEAQNVGT